MSWEARMDGLPRGASSQLLQVRFLIAYEVPEIKTCPWASNKAAKLYSLLGLHSEEKAYRNNQP